MLRIFLSVLLNCDPMRWLPPNRLQLPLLQFKIFERKPFVHLLRISKKFRLEGTLGKQPFSRNWNAINKLQEWEKEKKRNDFINMEYKFFTVCKLASKRLDECHAMPSAMPWLEWMTENEKEVMVSGIVICTIFFSALFFLSALLALRLMPS